jgi:hypothetical protein
MGCSRHGDRPERPLAQRSRLQPPGQRRYVIAMGLVLRALGEI